MAYDYGFDFRASSGFVTDPANTTYVLRTDGYPTTRGGSTFGWSVGAPNDVDRSAAVDPRLAGVNFDDATATFRIDLGAAGAATISLAFGDQGASHINPNQITFKDDTATLFSIGPHAQTADKFWDAADVEYTSAAWPGSQAGSAQTFSSTILNALLGTPGENWTLAHIRVASAAAAGGALLVKN